MRIRLPHSRRDGLTFPELVIGMAITAIVTGALAAGTLAVTEEWNNNDGTQLLQLQASQIYARVHHYVASSLYVCSVTPGALNSPTTPAGVLLWSFQGAPYSANTKALAGELSYLYYDGAGTLWLYQPLPYASMTGPQQTASAGPLSFGTINVANWATANFMTYNYVKGTVIGRNLAGVYFNANWLTSTTQRPALEFALAVSRSGQTLTTQYDIAVLRAPAQQPN